MATATLSRLPNVHTHSAAGALLAALAPAADRRPAPPAVRFDPAPSWQTPPIAVMGDYDEDDEDDDFFDDDTGDTGDDDAEEDDDFLDDEDDDLDEEEGSDDDDDDL
jgi:hypothetical protein